MGKTGIGSRMEKEPEGVGDWKQVLETVAKCSITCYNTVTQRMTFVCGKWTRMLSAYRESDLLKKISVLFQHIYTVSIPSQSAVGQFSSLIILCMNDFFLYLNVLRIVTL